MSSNGKSKKDGHLVNIYLKAKAYKKMNHGSKLVLINGLIKRVIRSTSIEYTIYIYNRQNIRGSGAIFAWLI